MKFVEPQKMPLALQPHEEQKRGYRSAYGDQKEKWPTRRRRDKARRGREDCPADSGERGQQRKQRCRMASGAAECREIGDEDHRTNAAGKILRDDCDH